MSALLGMLLLALLTVGTGIAAEGDTGVHQKESITGSDAGMAEKENTGPKEQPGNTGDNQAVVPPKEGSSRPPDQSTPPAAFEPKPEDLATESVQQTSPAKEESAAAAAVGPAADSVSAPPSPEETVDQGEGQAQEPATVAVQTPVAIEPDFVQALTGITAGRNDSNPVWSPSGAMIAFERSVGDNREIIVARSDGSIIQTIQCRLSDGDSEMEFFMPGVLEETSYNAGISWSPDENRLVFMSNGGSGNYDLYLLPALGREDIVRLTENTEKDSHPHWNPVNEKLAFVSGRSGKAEIYVMDLTSRQVHVMTNGVKTYLYPQWSPDGSKLALIYGSNENHDIYLIEDLRQPAKSLKTLTTWDHDDLRPTWSPDGKMIAFYSNYNPAADPKVWSIVVVAVDGSDPTEGQALADKVVARNVVPDVERGPAWMPDSRRIVFVKNDPKAYNPIYITDIDNSGERPLRTETRMNHDVVCSKNGTLAFRSQTEQWDHIYIARLKEEPIGPEPE